MNNTTTLTRADSPDHVLMVLIPELTRIEMRRSGFDTNYEMTFEAQESPFTIGIEIYKRHANGNVDLRFHFMSDGQAFVTAIEKVDDMALDVVQAVNDILDRYFRPKKTVDL